MLARTVGAQNRLLVDLVSILSLSQGQGLLLVAVGHNETGIALSVLVSVSLLPQA